MGRRAGKAISSRPRIGVSAPDSAKPTRLRPQSNCFEKKALRGFINFFALAPKYPQPQPRRAPAADFIPAFPQRGSSHHPIHPPRADQPSSPSIFLLQGCRMRCCHASQSITQSWKKLNSVQFYANDRTVKIYISKTPISDFSARNAQTSSFFLMGVPQDGVAAITATLEEGEIHPCGPVGF